MSGARYCPNMTPDNILGRYIYTGREYTQEMVNMRGGDIFMGAFNAEQVMYNHFGYRSPIPNLYNAGSAGHPGGAISGGSGYITAGIIAEELGIKPWWVPGMRARRSNNTSRMSKSRMSDTDLNNYRLPVAKGPRRHHYRRGSGHRPRLRQGLRHWRARAS